MVRRLQLDPRAATDLAGMDHSLEKECVRVAGERRAEPPEVRWFGLTLRSSPEFTRPREVLRAERYPDVPGEPLLDPGDRNLQVAYDEEMLVVDDALVG